MDIRSGSHDYLETCSGTDSVTTRIAVTALGSINSSSGAGNAGTVPLAGPVKIPDHYRYVRSIIGANFDKKNKIREMFEFFHKTWKNLEKNFSKTRAPTTENSLKIAHF